MGWHDEGGAVCVWYGIAWKGVSRVHCTSGSLTGSGGACGLLAVSVWGGGGNGAFAL